MNRVAMRSTHPGMEASQRTTSKESAVPEVKGVAMRSTHPGMEASKRTALKASAVSEVK